MRPPAGGAAYHRFVPPAGHGAAAHRRNWADYVEVGACQIALEAIGHARVRDADFYYQLVKWVSRMEVEASVDHAGMERANAREQRALSHLWQVRGEAEDASVGV